MGEGMRILSLSSVVTGTLLAASLTAVAADLPVRAPAAPYVPVPITTWTGCYIGGNIGGAFGHASISGVSGSISRDGSGFAGGGQIGCDYQFNGGWVIGLRDMFDGTSNKRSGTFATGPLAGSAVNFNNQWFDTLTGRLGYSFAPTTLVYFQGGGAWAHTSTNVIMLAASKLARPPPPDPGGRLAVALNGCLRRTGRGFSRAITWTSGPSPGLQLLRSTRLVQQVVLSPRRPAKAPC